jgi:para-nitrobenzyl esterase
MGDGDNPTSNFCRYDAIRCDGAGIAAFAVQRCYGKPFSDCRPELAIKWLRKEKGMQKQIETRLGKVTGLITGTTETYLGLPYAAPPVGDLRWMPPAPADRWEGCFDATRHPNKSWQMAFPSMLTHQETGAVMSEDMLYLNIHTPTADGARRPVLVYIHGGGYTVGSASDFDPTPFVRKHDAVVVSINYRLGIFGFLDLSRFGPEYQDSASIGVQDQIAALQWVQDNIADYGGDPGNVTVCGVSAGAGSTIALLAAPLARGLFVRAAAFSPAEFARTPGDFISPFAAAMQMDDDGFFAHLRSLEGKGLFDIQTNMGLTGGAAVDGKIVVAPIFEAVHDNVNPVPLIVGTCINEGTMLTAAIDETEIPGLDKIIEGIGTTIGGGEPDRYLRFLATQIPADASQRQRMTRFWYDHFRSPTLRVAEAGADVGMPVWVYSFEVPTGNIFGPTHASDLAFTFNLFDDDQFAEGQEIGFHPKNDENRRIAAMWTDAVARFMRSGDPAGGDLGEWPVYDKLRRASLVLRSAPMVVEDLDGPAARAAYGITAAGAN